MLFFSYRCLDLHRYVYNQTQQKISFRVGYLPVSKEQGNALARLDSIKIDTGSVHLSNGRSEVYIADEMTIQ